MSWCGGGEIEADARGRVPGARHPRVHLAGRQLTSLAWLRALRHLDLDVVGVRQVHARDAEAAGRDLLDRAAALGVEQALHVLAALAGVRLRAEPVHGDRERLVRLLRDGAVAHRAGREALDDRRDRLDLVDRHRLGGGAQSQQAAERLELLCLVVDEPRVVAEHVVAARARRVLQLEHRLGVEQVRGAVATPLVLPAGREPLVRERRALVRVGGAVAEAVLLRDHIEADAAERRVGAGEVAVDELSRQADRSRDSWRRGRSEAGQMPIFDMILRRPFRRRRGSGRTRFFDGEAVFGRVGERERLDAAVGEPGVHEGGAVADEAGVVVIFARLAAVADERHLHALAPLDEVVVHGRGREQHRDRRPVLVATAVGEHEERVPLVDRGFGAAAQVRERDLEAAGAELGAEAGVEAFAAERAVALAELLDPRELDGARIGEGNSTSFANSARSSSKRPHGPVAVVSDIAVRSRNGSMRGVRDLRERCLK